MRARGREEAARACGVEQLDRLHRHDDQRERLLAEVEAGRVGLAPLIVEVLGAGALGQCGEQLAVAVERGHVVARARQLQRDAAGAGADVEDRPVGLAASARHSGRSAS